MPFTEDLRRRLRVVSASSPVSSQATSPLLMRSQFSAQPSPYRPQRSSLSETDDQQISFGANFKVHANEQTWDKTLEAIGEASSSDLLDISKSIEGEGINPAVARSNNENGHLFANKHNDTTFPTNLTKAQGKHAGVNRSKSCPQSVSSLALSNPISHQSSGERVKDKKSLNSTGNDEVQIQDAESSSPSGMAGEFENTDGIILQFASSDPVEADSDCSNDSSAQENDRTSPMVERRSDNTAILSSSSSTHDISPTSTIDNHDQVDTNGNNQPATSNNSPEPVQKQDGDLTKSLRHQPPDSRDTAIVINETIAGKHTADSQSNLKVFQREKPPLPDDLIIRYSRAGVSAENIDPAPDQWNSGRRESSGFEFKRDDAIVIDIEKA